MSIAVSQPAATGAAAAPPQSAATGAAGGGGAFANGDFETFLRMLTTQIKNQDPLNPMEGSDFAVQLATFSGVEQQVRTNELLASLGGSLGLSGLSQYAGWIGREVRSTAPLRFEDTPLALQIEPDRSADSVVLVTRDAQGREVTREEIGTGSGEVDWFGRDALGNKLPDGAYSFTIENRQGETLLSEAAVPAWGRVSEARLGADGAVLVLEGGTEVAAAAVSAIRDAG